MGFFPDVNAGDPFIPNAGLSNAVRHIVNALNGFQSDAIPAKNMSIIRVAVYNASTVSFAAGQAVSLDLDGAIIHDAYPAVAYDEDLPCYGVCVSGATAGGISDCVLTGIAKVIISGGTASSYAKPVSGGTFETSDEEGFRIINISGGTSAVILMGDYVKTGGSNYTPGIGITITGGTEGEPYTINANITGDGDNIAVSGGTEGNPLVISYIGSGGGGSTFAVPPYSALSFGGGAPEYGLGHTFILAVKAGDVGFYDDGGGAVGKWTNKAGTTSQYITGGTSYHATEDGWLRISVVDNGLAPGRCLGFYSPTGGFPLYKYGSFSVSGIGYPDYIALAGGTASNALGTITDEDYEEGITPVPGPSTMPQNPKLGITNFLPVPAGTPIKYYASTAVLVRFAPVWGGGHFYYDLSNELEWTPNCAGWLRVSILDDGTHSSDCFRLYVGGVQWSDAVPLYKCGTFQGGATGISASISDGTASITLSGGTGSVKFLGSGSITISGGSNGEIIIHGATSGGGGGGYIPRWGTHFHYNPQDAADKNWMYYDEINNQTIVELYSLNPRHMTAGARGYLKGSSLSPDNSFTTAAEGYLFCFAEIACDGNATASNPGSVHAVIGYGQFKVCSVYGSSISVGGSVVIPIRANQTIELNMSNIDTSSSIIGMIFYENGKDYRYPDESE